MQKVKKLLCVLLLILIAASFFACGKDAIPALHNDEWDLTNIAEILDAEGIVIGEIPSYPHSSLNSGEYIVGPIVFQRMNITHISRGAPKPYNYYELKYDLPRKYSFEEYMEDYSETVTYLTSLYGEPVASVNPENYDEVLHWLVDKGKLKIEFSTYRRTTKGEVYYGCNIKQTYYIVGTGEYPSNYLPYEGYSGE